MTEPLVCAVMLTADRPEMAKRAIRSFEAQTYPNRRLLIYDTGKNALVLIPSQKVAHFVMAGGAGLTIGALRNVANSLAIAEYSPDIICHWDDDDWSAPERIEEQVGHLSKGLGAHGVGYSEMLFHDARTGEAWLYTNPMSCRAIGTSLMYWADAWKARKFANLPTSANGSSEYADWVRDLQFGSVSAVRKSNPSMVASIHGGNTADYSIIHESNYWNRVPEWDARVRQIMEEK